jgi:Flp pilus assembly protein TadG
VRAHSQRGFVLVTTILATVALLSFCGLAIDVGYLFLVKTRMQTAADAAALGAVQELRASGASGVVSAAKGDAAANGFTDGMNSVAVTVNRPPQGGYYMSDPTAVEVVVTQNAPTFFMQVLGFTSMRVTARAVARQGPGSNCVYSLNPTANKALWQTGSGEFVSPCGIYVNSSDSKAFYFSGSGSIEAEIDIVGSYYQGGSGSVSPAPISGVPRPPVIDPLASRALPSIPGNCDYNNRSVSGIATLDPGVYCGGLSITGSGAITFNPGLYIINGGGLSVSGSGSVSGNGVTIYDTADGSHTYKGIQISGSGEITLSAPSSGPYESLLLIGDRTRASSLGSSVTGSGNLHIDGVIYLPREELAFAGSSGSRYQVLIADTLKITGSAQLNNDYSGLSSGAPIRGSGVVSE